MSADEEMLYVHLLHFCIQEGLQGMSGTKHRCRETKWLYKHPTCSKNYRLGLTHMELNTSPNHQLTLWLKSLSRKKSQ